MQSGHGQSSCEQNRLLRSVDVSGPWASSAALITASSQSSQSNLKMSSEPYLSYAAFTISGVARSGMSGVGASPRIRRSTSILRISPSSKSLSSGRSTQKSSPNQRSMLLYLFSKSSSESALAASSAVLDGVDCRAGRPTCRWASRPCRCEVSRSPMTPFGRARLQYQCRRRCSTVATGCNPGACCRVPAAAFV
jgi:hypothetical protein